MIKLIILGIDPGYAIVGYGVVDYSDNNFRTLAYGAITTPADMTFEKRLEAIYDDMQLLMDRYSPAEVAIEKLFFTTNQKTIMPVGMARGIIFLSAVKNNVDIFEYTPLQVKQAVVGYGKAEKKQVMELTKSILKLEKIPKPDDAADALAIAVCHAHSTGNRHRLTAYR